MNLARGEVPIKIRVVALLGDSTRTSTADGGLSGRMKYVEGTPSSEGILAMMVLG